MVTITCKLPEALDHALEVAAKKRRISKSQLLRESLEALLLKQPSSSRSFDARMSKVRGMVKSGKKDLGSNKKHLEGFGE